MTEERDQVRLQRGLLVTGAAGYLGWWLFVHLALPSAFNPLLSRAAVVACFLFAYAVTFFPISRHPLWLFPACSALATVHYYYLFDRNHADLNWVIGSFILVTAVSAAIQSARALLFYSLLVAVLSSALVIRQPELPFVVFLPGILTTLLFANVGLRFRLRLHAQLRATLIRVEREHQLHLQSLEAVKTRDEFISSASHELRTPLTILRLQTDSARRSLAKREGDGKSPELFRRTLDQTDAQTTKLIRLVEDMFDISRISSDNLALELEALSLSEIARETVDAMEDLLQRAGCDVRLDVDSDVPVFADRTRLEQVIRNLLSNVMKYAGGKPTEVTVRAEGSFAILAVVDHGIGISKADQRRIFEKFERAVSSTNFSGLGLGLYLARRIVEKLGGTIDVESEPDRGATFRVILPLRESAAAAS